MEKIIRTESESVMPWTTAGNKDERKYVVSKYAKEELPTWSEVYEEFYKNKMYSYNIEDPNHTSELDPYWCMHRRKVIIATVCNQFNKTIFEDGYKKKLIQMIHDTLYANPDDVRFVCETIQPWVYPKEGRTFSEYTTEWQEFCINKFVGINSPPPIYQIPFPNGKPNPFVTSNIPRIDISNSKLMCIYPVIRFASPGMDHSIIAMDPSTNSEFKVEFHQKIIDFMMLPYKEYFENGIGWKDENGNLLESTPMTRLCDGVGSDPAL